MSDLTVSGVSAANGAVRPQEIQTDTVIKEVKDSGLITSDAIQNAKKEEDGFVPSNEKNSDVTEEISETIEDKIKAEKAKEKETVQQKKEEAEEKVEQQKEEEKKVEKQVMQENSALAKQAPKVKLVKRNGKWEAVKPDTPAFRTRDKHMNEVKRKYIEKFPEPSFSSEGSDTKSESVEHSKWQIDLEKHLRKEDTDYRTKNKVYDRERKAYDNAKRKAQNLNKSK